MHRLRALSRGDLRKGGTEPLVVSGAGNLTGDCRTLVERLRGSSAEDCGSGCVRLGRLGRTGSDRGCEGIAGDVTGGTS